MAYRKHKPVGLLTAIILLVIFLPIAYFVTKNASPSEAAWFDDTYTYRQRFEIANAGTTQTDFQVSITLDTATLISAGKMQSDCRDIRVVDLDNKILPHWVETNGLNSCNQTTTVIWVKASSLHAGGTTLLAYYGNSSAENISDGNKVFIFFDDFNNVVIDTTKWTATGNLLSTSTSTASGRLRADRANGTGSIYSNTTFARPFILDMDYYPTQYPSGWEGGYHGTMSFGTYNSSKNTEHAWVPHGGGGNSYCGFCDDGGCYHGTYVNPVVVGDTLYKISMQAKSLIAGPQGVMTYTNRKDDGTGSQANSTIYTVATTGDDPLYIGVKDYGGNMTDDFEWDNWRVRKYADTLPVAGSPASEEINPAPIAYWKFDEGYGTTTNNSSSISGLNGTLGTNASWKTKDQCISGMCLYIDDSGSSIWQTVTVNDHSSLGNMSALTVGVWIKTVSNKTTQQIIYKRQTNGTPAWSSFRVELNSLKPSFYVTNSSGTQVSAQADSAIEQNKWYYLTGIYDGSQVQIYVNAAPADSTPASLTGNVLDSDYRLQIGGLDTASSYYFKGFIDEPKIYPYARTADQIKADYASGLAGMGSSSDSSVNIGGASSGKSLSDGLVGYWKFDEGVGTTSADSSGNNNLSTLSGSTLPEWSNGKYGIGLSFNGVNNYASVADNSIFALGNNSMSISSWVKFNSAGIGVYQGIVSQGIDSFEINKSSLNKLRMEIRFNDNSYLRAEETTASLTQANIWYHVTATFNPITGSILLYVNGQSQAVSYIDSQVGGTLKDSASLIYFGTRTPGSLTLNGLLDEIRIYNRALSPAEVSSLYNWAPGPVVYYDFEEGSGAVLNDNSGNNRNGSYIGSPQFSSGKFGKGMRLTTTGQYATVPGLGNYVPAQEITIEYWAKPDSVSGYQNAFWIGTDTPDRINVHYYWSSSQYWDFGTCCTPRIVLSPGIVAGQWDHFAYVSSVSGNYMRIYKNGIQIGSNATPGTFTPANYPLYIGNQPNGSYPLLGTIDDFKIYNYARTSGQIIEDMNAGHPLGGSPVGSQLVWYKFNEGSGSIANNSGFGGATLNGIFGASTAAPSWSNTGKSGKALNFTAANNTYTRAPITSTNGLNIKGAITYSVWFKRATNTGYQTLIDMIDSCGVDGDGYYLRFNNSQLVFTGIIDNAVGPDPFVLAYTNAATTGDTTNWHHVVVTWDGTTNTNGVKMYIDGTQVAQTTAANDGSLMASLNGRNLSVGTLMCNTHSFDGLIDEVKIYNAALTAEEIKLDYNQGAATVFGSSNQTISGTTTSLEYCIPGDTSSCSAPIAEWKFEEGVGTTAYDSSGNNNNGVFGTGSSAPSWTTGKVGKALNFNGTTNYISSPSISISNSISVSAWVKSTNFNQNGFIIGKNPVNTQWELFFESNTLKWRGGSSTSVNCTPPSNNQWYYLSAVQVGTTATVYIDGVQCGTGPVTTIGNGSGTVDIGRFSSGYYFNGLIDQVRIYNYARTPAQIAYDYNKGAPVGHWKLDECQGTAIHDSSGNNNHGTLSIGASGTQTTPGTCQTSGAWANGSSGKLNSSLNFDGTDDSFSVGNPSIINFGTNNFSYCYWVKTTSTTGQLVGKGTWNYDAWGSFVTNNRARFEIKAENPPGTGFSADSLIINNNQWHHLCGSYDRTGYLHVYTDGKLTNSTNISSISTYNINNSFNFIVGSGAPGYISGQLDDVRIYNYALTLEQIKQVYTNGAINFGPATGSP